MERGSTGSYPILILLNAGCALIRLVRRCGTRSATGTPLRQMTKDSLEFSTVASRLEKFVFASWTFTVFMLELLVQLVLCVNAFVDRALPSGNFHRHGESLPHSYETPLRMKSVGEALAIGRTFKESPKKCLRPLETR